MNKILTVSIAAYNVEKYIEKTLNSLLIDDIDDLEILVEDDGGTDNTADIVKKYEEKYPGIVKLVHKENGGYGSTINKSMELATGKYFKQLDGDDWYETENFKKFVNLLKTVDSDAIYTPYNKYLEKEDTYVLKDYFDSELSGEYKISEVIGKSSHSIEMHNLTYKTELLRKNKIELLTKCFYTDTQFALFPLINLESLYISHIPIYVYRVGRDEQSVSIPGHRKHYEDHVRVSKEIMKFYNEFKNKIDDNKKHYLFECAKTHVTNTISGFYMVLESNKEVLNMIKEFDAFVEKTCKDIYDAMLQHSQVIKLLRKTNYNYIVYKMLSNIQIKRKQKEK